MTAQVVILPAALATPTADLLVTRVRKMVHQPNGMRFDHPHFQLRLKQRRLGMRQVLETVTKGCAIGDPMMDAWGDWRIKLRRKVAGRRVQVVVAIKANHFVVVTVI